MSIPSEIERLKANKAAAFAAVGEKGGTVPTNPTSANLPAAIDSIPVSTGIDTSDADAKASEIAKGKVAYTKDGRTVGTAVAVFRDKEQPSDYTYISGGRTSVLIDTAEYGLFCITPPNDMATGDTIRSYYNTSTKYVGVRCANNVGTLQSGATVLKVEVFSSGITINCWYTGTTYD